MSPSVSLPDPHARRFGVVTAFVLVVVGLAVVDGLAWIAVRPQLHELESIGRDHARSVEIAAHIRSRMSALRREVVRAVAIGRSGGEPSSSGAGQALRRLADEADSLAPLTERFARGDLARLRGALAQCAQAADEIEPLLGRGDRVAARAELDRFLDLTGNASDAADAIVALNAREVEQGSLRIRGALAWTLAGSSIMSALGAIAAAVLLRKALRGLSRDDALWRSHCEEVDAFASRAAHELRTPLQTLGLSLAVLDVPVRSTRALERARGSVVRLRRTIDELLEFSRAGVPSDRVAWSEVAPALDDVRDELGAAVEEGKVVLEFGLQPRLEVAMAPEHLRTVLRNLVGNALKYARSEHGRVAVHTTAQGANVRIEVADNGPGIPPEALPRVFDPFFRASRQAGGFGIGLATVRRLVEAHHGRIALSSEMGRGTTVRVELPRVNPPTDAAPRSGATHA